LYFDPENLDEVSKSRVISIFELEEDSLNFFVEVKKVKQFKMVLKLMSLGNSFRQIANILTAIAEETGMSVYTACSREIISNFDRIVCASSLQKCQKSLMRVAFSIAFGVSVHKSHSYIDIRIRFCVSNKIENFHLVAPPIYDQYT
jgi:hypothetical protein